MNSKYKNVTSSIAPLHQSMQLRLQHEQQRLAMLQQRIRIKYFYDNVQRQKQASIDLSSQLHKQIQRILTSKSKSFNINCYRLII